MSIELNGTTGIDFNDGSNQSTAATPYARKNLLINGDMKIAQRGTSTSGITGDNYYTVDRFAFQLNSSGTWTQSQDTDVPTGQGFVNSLKMQCTTSTASPNYFIVQQRIEAQNLQHLAYGTASAKTVTASFWVKSNKTGTYINELYIQDDNRTISTAFTISSANTWEKKVITFAGDTVGVIDNDNGLGMYMSIWLATGSTFSSGTLQTSWGSLVQANRAVGQVNLADNTANYINITGCQLEIGDSASDFEFVPYDMELQRCQRYLPALNGIYWTTIGYNILTNIGVGFIKFPVTARVPATGISYSSLSHFTVANNTNTSYTPTSISFDVSNREGASILFSTSTGLTQGNPSRMYASNSSVQLLFNGCEL